MRAELKEIEDNQIGTTTGANRTLQRMEIITLEIRWRDPEEETKERPPIESDDKISRGIVKRILYIFRKASISTRDRGK